MNKFSHRPYAFIMPHRNTGSLSDLKLLMNSIKEIFRQTDDNWVLIIIDDNSLYQDSLNFLNSLAIKYPEKIIVRFLSERKGPAYCRNLAIKLSMENNFPVVMFNDSDDISHIKRTEITRRFFNNLKSYNLLYSTFIPVDERGNVIRQEFLTPSLLEIIEAHSSNPLQGYDVWKYIGTKSGYINLTSSTSVCTDLAVNFPFPNEEVSEDSHTWMRYSAGGAKFVFTEKIPVKYRITLQGSGSSTRDRFKSKFYSEKARVDEDGFKKSIKIVKDNHGIDEEVEKELLVCFYLRLSESMIKEGATEVADALLVKSIQVSKKMTNKNIESYKVVYRYLYSGV